MASQNFFHRVLDAGGEEVLCSFGLRRRRDDDLFRVKTLESPLRVRTNQSEVTTRGVVEDQPEFFGSAPVFAMDLVGGVVLAAVAAGGEGARGGGGVAELARGSAREDVLGLPPTGPIAVRCRGGEECHVRQGRKRG